LSASHAGKAARGLALDNRLQRFPRDGGHLGIACELLSLGKPFDIDRDRPSHQTLRGIKYSII
jgi:hypothetical protein